MMIEAITERLIIGDLSSSVTRTRASIHTVKQSGVSMRSDGTAQMNQSGSAIGRSEFIQCLRT